MSHVISKPPAKNPITATKEGNCKSASPDIACPEVQPPAYLAPKPIKNPPTIIIIKPLTVNSDAQE